MSLIALAALTLAAQGNRKPAPPKKKPKTPVAAPMIVSVDAKPDEPVSGERTFKVSVQSGAPVTQVEFYVGSDLRDADSSVPYLFKLDTLEETDGPLRLRFKAYTSTGKSAEKAILVRIANDVAAGAPAHVAKGREALQAGKAQEAVTEGRIALKADPDSADAKLLLGTAYYQLKVYDRAQKYAEDALAARKGDGAALNLLSSIAIRQAFSTFSRGTEGAANATIGGRLNAGIEARRQAAENALDALGAPTADNAIAYADAANRANRYSLAINALEPILRTKPERKDAMERMLYAQLRAGRYADAAATLRAAARFLPEITVNEGGRNVRVPEYSPYALAVQAIVHEIAARGKDADTVLARAAAKAPDDPGVRTTRAYLALRRDDRKALAAAAADLTKDASADPVALFYVGAVAARQQRYEPARDALQAGALADPLLGDLYIENGLRSLALADAIKAKIEPAPGTPPPGAPGAGGPGRGGAAGGPGGALQGAGAPGAPGAQGGPSTETEEEKKAREKRNAEKEKEAAERRKPYFASADTMFRAALAAKPDSGDALAGLTATALLENRLADAIKFGEAAAAAQPNSAVAQVALASALSAQSRLDKTGTGDILVRAREASRKAIALAPSLEGRAVARPEELWKLLAGAGRTPVIAAPR